MNDKPLHKLLEERGTMSFAQFMRTALYEPDLGYYARKGRLRVGAGAEADFFTAEAIGPVFARLAVEACAGNCADASRTAFVELGSEGEGDVASRASPPFASAHSPASFEGFPPGPLLFFSNELFDAQPFHRLVRHDGRWRECGVAFECGRGREVLLDAFSPRVEAFAHRLPRDAEDGWRLDLPLEAADLMDAIAARPGVETIVAFDYGLDWADILLRRPGGTARAYRAQKLVTDLLADPGEQDLTCHIAWDGLEEALRARGYATKVRSQEAFFIHHAGGAIRAIMEKGDPFECGKLRELIHPSRMGAAFQVLVARRVVRAGPD